MSLEGMIIDQVNLIATFQQLLNDTLKRIDNYISIEETIRMQNNTERAYEQQDLPIDINNLNLEDVLLVPATGRGRGKYRGRTNHRGRGRGANAANNIMTKSIGNILWANPYKPMYDHYKPKSTATYPCLACNNTYHRNLLC